MRVSMLEFDSEMENRAKAKDYLLVCLYAKRKADALEFAAAEARAKAEGTQSRGIVASGGKSAPRGLEDSVSRVLDAVERYAAAVAKWAELVADREDTLCRIGPDAAAVLSYRYVLGWTVSRTASRLNVSERTVSNIARAGLDELFYEMPGEWRSARRR